MKFYSEKTQEMYDTQKELEFAEKKYDLQKANEALEEIRRKKEERRKEKEKDERRDAVTKAYDDAYEAYQRAQGLAEEYVKDYGEFKYSKEIPGFTSLFPQWIAHWLDS